MPEGPAGSFEAVRPVAKTSLGKATNGGRKWAARRFDTEGYAIEEIVTPGPAPIPDGTVRALQVELVRSGERCDHRTVHDARDHHRGAVAALRPEHRDLAPGDPALPTVER